MKASGCELRIGRRGSCVLLLRERFWRGRVGVGARGLSCADCLAGSGRRGTQLRGGPPCRPRAADSALMPLRRAPRRPDLANGFGVQPVRGSPIRPGTTNQLAAEGLAVIPPLQTSQSRCRGSRGGWRSEIKEERSGGHSRSYPPRFPRLANARTLTSGSGMRSDFTQTQKQTLLKQRREHHTLNN